VARRPARRALLPRCLFSDAAPRGISTLSLHDALPILVLAQDVQHRAAGQARVAGDHEEGQRDPRQDHPAQEVLLERGPGLEEVEDRKSTRLNSSHVKTSYAVFCLKKKKRT